ncbi:MAG: M20 family peptidase [Alphaproteobacteria bacterium]|nr:M20 family peptidase [Alphaproteobacteria bacterium]
MRLETLKAEVSRGIDAMRGQLLEISHSIHAHPELAFKEHHAHALLTGAVREAGLKVTPGAYDLETAFEAEFGADTGPRVALLAEYDALPGIGHSCGHNLIATSALGAALALHGVSARLPGRVRLLGTPAEESGGGKELMARRGAFGDVDAAMMMHPAGVNLATMPSIAWSEVRVSYRGVSSHASAMPERGVNALDALITAYNSIAMLRQHIRSSERIHGIILNGGDAPNIVPEFASGHFYVRARDMKDLAVLRPRVLACFEAGARAAGAALTVEWSDVDYLELRTNWPIATRFQKNAEALGRIFTPIEKIPPSVRGSTDMGNVSHLTPSIHPMLACAPPHVSIHNPEFARYAGSASGDDAAIDGAKALALTALDYLFDASLRDEARQAFEKAKHISAIENSQAEGTRAAWQ